MADVQISETKEPLSLPLDELAALDEGIRSAEVDRPYTLEEVVKFARQWRKAWKQAPEVTSA